MDNPEAGSPPSRAAAGGGPPPAHPAYPAYRPTNGLAIAALVVGGVSFVSCPLIGAVAVYLGNRARSDIRRSGENGDSLALAGLILGWCALALAALMILFMVAYFGFFAVMFSRSAGAG